MFGFNEYKNKSRYILSIHVKQLIWYLVGLGFHCIPMMGVIGYVTGLTGDVMGVDGDVMGVTGDV